MDTGFEGEEKTEEPPSGFTAGPSGGNAAASGGYTIGKRPALSPVSVSTCLAQRELAGTSLRASSARLRALASSSLLHTTGAGPGQLHFHGSFVHDLRVVHVLKGHRGCVNRLSWNAEGTMLASGSDDQRVLLWGYPSRKQLTAIDTGHSANIFGVRFLPCTGNNVIATGAMDTDVRSHTVEPSMTSTFRCHADRVKAVDIEPGSPHHIFSASEDGTVRQFDLRCHRANACRSSGELSACCSATLLVGLGPPPGFNAYLGGSINERFPVEAKGLALNPIAPWQMAVACGDAFVRIYDRRKLSLGASSPAEALMYLAPPHLASGAKRRCPPPTTHTTAVHFGQTGTSVIATYHRDHAYAMDIRGDGSASPTRFENTKVPRVAQPNGTPKPALLAQAEKERLTGNFALATSTLTAAARHYSRAIYFAGPTWARPVAVASLYAQRALVYLRRAWTGDAAAALLDCEQAIDIDPNCNTAHLRRAQALKALGRFKEAKTAALSYQQKFPESETDSVNLLESIEQAAEGLERGEVDRDDSTDATGEEEEDSEEDSEEELQDLEDVGHSEEPNDSWRAKRERTASGDGASGRGGGQTTSRRTIWATSRRANRRYVGQCNIQTDIKEAVFLGTNDEFVAAGSDDGLVFIWHAKTGELVNILSADQDVANCVQPHPSACCIATSGIESVIRLWEPRAQCDDDQLTEQTPEQLDDLVAENQERVMERMHNVRRITPEWLQEVNRSPQGAAMLRALLQAEGMFADQFGEEEDGAPTVSCRQS